MPVVPIIDPFDVKLDTYRQLTDAQLLRERGLFLAEGRLVVERVLRDGRYEVESLLLNAAAVAALRPLLESLRESTPVYECPTAAFETITGFNIHRGCLAMVRRPPVATWQDLAAAAKLLVVLEGVTNADNVGGVFRNAAAFGADAVLLSPTSVDPLYRKAIRTSMGAVLGVPFARIEPWPNGLGQLRASGFTVVGLSPRHAAISLDAWREVIVGRQLALIVGSEGAGLTTAAINEIDRLVRIPINAAMDSLNLVVATGIALWHVSRTDREPQIK
jgi:tRNA G18 (ribose-2'-O)-methylase SpoU